MRLGRKNLRLLLDTEPAGDLLTLPLARVVRDGSGHFAYDPNFVPPVLRISASERLMLLVQRLIEILDEKSATISRGAGKRTGGVLHPRDRQLLAAARRQLGAALLRHQLVAKRGHPEELFVEMSRLAGALCTFALDSHPRDLPLYDHENLSECFESSTGTSARTWRPSSPPTACPFRSTRRAIISMKARSPISGARPLALGVRHPRPRWARRT